MSSPGEPCTKGQTFRSFVESLTKLRGKVACDATLARMPAHFHDLMGTMVPGGWYPIRWLTELHQAADLVTREGVVLSRAIGKAATLSDYRGIYRFFMILLSPQQILSRVPKAFSITWNTGSAEVVAVERGMVRVAFRGVTGFNPWLWDNLMGASDALVTLGGGKDVDVRAIAGGATNDWMDFEARWA